MKNAVLYIILPMFNEELSIPGLIAMFNHPLDLPLGWEYHLLVVNDGSQDRTLELANQWADGMNGMLTVISHEHNRGLGEAILTGFREALAEGATCVLTMDADASHPAATIIAMIDAIEKGADIVIASRFAPGGNQYGVPWKRRMLSLGARLLLSLCFPLSGIRDYTVSFRAYRADIIREALELSNDNLLKMKSFACAAELLLKTATLATKIQEVPLLLHYEDKKSISKLNIWRTIKDYIRLTSLPRIRCPLGKGIRIA